MNPTDRLAKPLSRILKQIENGLDAGDATPEPSPDGSASSHERPLPQRS